VDERAAAPVVVPDAIPVAPPPPVFLAPPVAPPPAPPSEPLLSPTLADLYFGQGAYDKAIDVYEQLLSREPGNERYQARIAEARRAAHAPTSEARQARRIEIEAQIARLEQLLTLVKRA
jgi:tetratricopeptide (TPR) repeat protein